MGQMKIRGNTQILDGTLSLSQLDAALKSLIYSGVDIKDSVRVATTVNIVLSGTQTIDGVALSVGNRVLVKNQTAPAENGIWVVAAGAWARSTDADSNDEVTTGLQTYVTEGNVNLGSIWTLITNAPIVLATTALTFTQSGGMSVLSAGAGLTAAGNVLNVGAGNGIAVAADAVAVSLSGTPGLEFSGSTLQVKVDNVGIERVAGGLQLKDNGVTNADLRDSAAYSVIGKATTGVGDPADITAAADQVLRRSGAGDLGFGTLVTNNLGNDIVTYAKMQNISAQGKLLGRKTAAAGDPEEIGLDETTYPEGGSNLEIAAAGIRVKPGPKFASLTFDNGAAPVTTVTPNTSGGITLSKVTLSAEEVRFGGLSASTLGTETDDAGRTWVLPNRDGTIMMRADYVSEEVPGGAINGANTAFTLANTPIASSVVLFLNGVRLRSGAGNDFTIAGANITMLYAPQTGDVLLATYLK